VKINKNPDSHLLKSCSASYLDSQQHEDDIFLTSLAQVNSELRDLFQSYCSFGDPTNTTHLKSAKL